MTVADVLLRHVAELVVGLADEPPEAEDVKAGWVAFVLFLPLLGAVVLLGFSLVKQLRKAQAAKDAGVYGRRRAGRRRGARTRTPKPSPRTTPRPSDGLVEA